jgi:predicted phosphodiesterase
MICETWHFTNILCNKPGLAIVNNYFDIMVLKNEKRWDIIGAGHLHISYVN